MVVKLEGVPSKEANVLIERVSSYLPDESTELVADAYTFADLCHQGQTRKSGEPYIAHPLETALFLADLRLDSHTIIDENQSYNYFHFMTFLLNITYES